MLLTAGLSSQLPSPLNHSDHSWHVWLPCLKPADLDWGFGHSQDHPPHPLACHAGGDGGFFYTCDSVSSVSPAPPPPRPWHKTQLQTGGKLSSSVRLLVLGMRTLALYSLQDSLLGIAWVECSDVTTFWMESGKREWFYYWFYYLFIEWSYFSFIFTIFDTSFSLCSLE